MLYVLRGGIAWRLLPHEFPPWQTVYRYFRRWRLDGTWERVNTAPRERVQVRAGRDPRPSAAMLDSQIAKSTAGSLWAGGLAALGRGKKVNGRKRHILVDTMGL